MSGSSSSQSSNSKPQLTPQQLVDVYNKNLPKSLMTTVGQAPAVSKTLAEAAAGANPLYTASGLSQLQQYAPGYQQIGAQLGQQQAAATADLMRGSGKDAAMAAYDIQKATNPDYYRAQEAASRGAAAGVNAINLNGLSPGEQNSVERLLNQGNNASGNLALANPTNTVSDAINFGGAFNSKLGLMNNAVGAASGAANSAAGNAGFNGVNVANNSSNLANNFAMGMFNPTQGNNLVTTPTQFGSSLFSALSSNASASPTNSSGGGTSGALCCFIFMESYYGSMPNHVRVCRDRYYIKFPDIAKGYCRMAKWLVPMMQRSSVIRAIVWHTMVNPLTQYGLFVTGKDRGKWTLKPVRKFWFTVWNYLGK